MGSVYNESSLSRVSEWLDTGSSDISSSRSGSRSGGGAPLSDQVGAQYNYQGTMPTSIGLVTRQGLRNQQVPTASNGFHFTLSGVLHPVFPQQNVISSADDKSRYTSRLMEYGQEKSVLPVYEYATISPTGTPSIFRCRVRFQGIDTNASASSKKSAKHEASFNACNMLGIAPI